MNVAPTMGKAVETEANTIAPGLYLGSVIAAEDVEEMQKRNITHVLICHPEMKALHPQRFIYGRMAIADDPSANLLELLPEALAYLCKARDDEKKGVFVHCQRGISRSSSCVIALLMFERRIGFDEAWKECVLKRPSVYPNVGFQLQLRYLEELLSRIDASGPWQKRLEQLSALVPRGSLEDPKSSLPIRERLSESMKQALISLESQLERCDASASVESFEGIDSDQARESWQRLGRYFENIQLYRTLPSDEALVQRSQQAANQLGKLSRGCRDQTCRGARLTLALSKALEGWTSAVGPLLGQGKLLLGGEYDSSDDDEDAGNGRGRSRSRSRGR